MSASVATAEAAAVRKVSAIRCHHDDAEIRYAVEMDRLRLMGTYPRGYSVMCDCSRDHRLNVEDCAGLYVRNSRGKPIARYHGQQYRAVENAHGAVAVYSTLVRC
jgi:hypothetical protein